MEKANFKGVPRKTNIWGGGDCLKWGGGLGQFADLRKGLGRKEGGGVFERGGGGGDTPMHTMDAMTFKTLKF